MTVDHAARLRYPNAVYDCALPQQWVDTVANVTHEDYGIVCSSFVWVYDEQARIFGRPGPLTEWAEYVLLHFQYAILKDEV